MNHKFAILEALELLPIWVERGKYDSTMHRHKETQVDGFIPSDKLPKAIEDNPEIPASVALGKPAIQPFDAYRDTISKMDWDTLRHAVATCTACSLCKTRRQPVFGVGNQQASLLVIGEAPGAEEDRQGEPFVGLAGKLLDNMLAAIGEQRGEGVFIANVLKCRPPGNRNPLPDEIMQCISYLKRQVELIRPRVILACGRFAAQSLLDTDVPLSALRGQLHQYQNIPVIVTYHPAYLLRNLPDKSKSWDDLLLLVDTLEKRAVDKKVLCN